MIEQPITHSTPMSGLSASLAGVAGAVTREAKLVSAERSGRAKLLASRELRKLANDDTAVADDLARATTAITGQGEVSTAWQKRLADATKVWQASLASFAKLHPDAG